MAPIFGMGIYTHAVSYIPFRHELPVILYKKRPIAHFLAGKALRAVTIIIFQMILIPGEATNDRMIV